jgi:hypothetical protein
MNMAPLSIVTCVVYTRRRGDHQELRPQSAPNLALRRQRRNVFFRVNYLSPSATITFCRQYLNSWSVSSVLAELQLAF